MSTRSQHIGLELLTEFAARQTLRPAARRFYFLRHGQTDGNRQRFFQGPEQPLNDWGIGQAQQAGTILRDTALSQVVASDMERTLQTARIAMADRPLAIQPSALLRERNFGNLIGSSSLVIDWVVHQPGGESLENFVLRVCEGLASALDRDDALVVAHGGTLYVLAAALGAPFDPIRHTANASPLRFERQETGWQITALDAREEQELNFS